MLYQRKIISVAWGIVYSVGCYQKKNIFMRATYSQCILPLFLANLISIFIYIEGGFMFMDVFGF